MHASNASSNWSAHFKLTALPALLVELRLLMRHSERYCILGVRIHPKAKVKRKHMDLPMHTAALIGNTIALVALSRLNRAWWS